MFILCALILQLYLRPVKEQTHTPATDFKEKMFLFWDVKYGEQVWSWQLEYKNTKNHQRESWIKINMKADVLEFWTYLHHNSICFVSV